VILSTMILVSSVALALFYFQATCENILNREFDGVRLKSVANAVRLEFLFVRKEMEEAKGRPIDYRWVSMALKCDYLALTYLMRNTGTYSRWERLLILYFRVLFLVVSAQHLLKLNEKRAILKLTTILNHFTSIVGERTGATQLSLATAWDTQRG
jgi:hypothetical protein